MMAPNHTTDSDLGYRDLFAAAPDGIVVVDDEGRILDANPATERLFGYQRDELVGRAVELLVPERSRGTHRAERTEFVRDPHARPMGIGMELRGLRRDGKEFPVEISLSPLRKGSGLFVIATIRDVTERKRLREFGAGALRAAEEERRRIARELHDDAAQRLASLLVLLRLARSETDPDERDRVLDRVREELLESADLVRRIARGLRPPALEDAGLPTAIRSHVRTQLELSDLDVELDLRPTEGELAPEARLVLYRVVQEGLSNVLRHAEADRVRITLREEAGSVVVELEDDGRGFDPNRVSDDGRGGLGLLGMRERAALIDARLDIETEPGEGTLLRIRVPTEAEGAADG